MKLVMKRVKGLFALACKAQKDISEPEQKTAGN